MNRRLWLKIVSVALLADGLCLCTAGRAEITSVRIVPARPSVVDTVMFTVEGMFPDGCWSTHDFSFVQVSPMQFAAEVHAYDRWDGERVCTDLVVDYGYYATLGPLEPGVYTILVTEHHQSIRDPWPNVASLTFEVADSLPPVRGLVASRSGNNIVLRWPAVGGVTGYRIYRGAALDFEIGPSSFLDSTLIPMYTDGNVILMPNEKLFYSVTATR